jgi:hypothetical protein
VKLIQIPPEREIQILAPYLLGTFFLENRYNKELVGQISSNSKFSRISNQFFLDFNS